MLQGHPGDASTSAQEPTPMLYQVPNDGLQQIYSNTEVVNPIPCNQEVPNGTPPFVANGPVVNLQPYPYTVDSNFGKQQGNY